VVRVTLPADFSAWATSNAMQISYNTNQTSTAENKLDVTIYNANENPSQVVRQVLNNVSSSSKTWTTLTIDDSELDDGTAPDWDAAGETAIVHLRMYSRGSSYTQVGDIVLNYLAKF
jgi:hypothetical protein